MPEGGRLRVAVEAVPNNRIKIVFEDTGSGMSPEQVEQLFEPFSNSTSGGTGLGLSIVYQIIRDHGGTINVRSIEEEGTRITIELPRESKIPAAPPKDADEPSPPSLLENYLNVKTDESEITS